MKRKLVLFGIDGADWNIIDPLIAEGALPNFKKAKEGGTHSELMSTIPALTAPAWRSIFTGVNPGKHGVFDFMRVENGKIKLTSAKDTKSPYFWEAMDGKVLAFNIPCAFPLRKIQNTTMITGFGTPSSDSEFTDPPELATEIKSLSPNYSFRALEADLISLDSATGKDGLAESILEAINDRVRVARHLMETREWDAALMIFSATDWMQHYAIHGYFESKKKSDTPVGQTYAAMDGFLGYLMEKGYDIIIVSDHGFREIKRVFYINSYLRDKGFIRLKPEPAHQRAFRKIGLFRERIVSSLPKSLTKRIGPHKLSAKLDRVFPGDKISVVKIDADNSSAFLVMQSGGGLHVNDKIDGVIRVLREARDESGRNVIRAIFRREDIYLGDHVDKAPHLTIVPEDGYAVNEKLPEKAFHDINPQTEKTGVHRPQGIFLSYGAGFRSMGQIGKCSVMDIAPTILSYYGYDVPAFMDGEVIPVTGKGKKNTLRIDTRMKLRKMRKMK